MISDKLKIAQYYDQTLSYYDFFWHKKTHAIHYGFSDKNTVSIEEALLNTNRFLAEKAEIVSGSRVLDAGCGIGGSTIWLAKNCGAQVVGISLSERQVEKAKALAVDNDVENMTDFKVMDYLNTEFPDNSFDVIWGLESICYAEHKIDFMNEAFRLLKPGGKIVVADGFLQRPPRGTREDMMLDDFLDGLVLPNLALVDDFKSDLGKAGFQNITYFDKRVETEPSSKKLHRMCLLASFFRPVLKKFSRFSDLVIGNLKAGVAQRKMVKVGLASYGVFYAEK
jgi:tocopherol O-methyltransferase